MTSYGMARMHDEMYDALMSKYEREENRWDAIADRRKTKDAKRSTYMRGCVYSRNR